MKDMKDMKDKISKYSDARIHPWRRIQYEQSYQWKPLGGQDRGFIRYNAKANTTMKDLLGPRQLTMTVKLNRPWCHDICKDRHQIG